jgi:hypothetical protein
MPEPYAVMEYKLNQSQTMPPSPGRQLMWLHAGVEGEGREVTVACSYLVVPGRDVPRRDLPFSDFEARRQQVSKCPACAAAIEATV